MDLTAVANTLMQSNELAQAEDLLKSAAARATNSVEYTTSERVLANDQFHIGKKGEADASIKKALAVFDLLPNEANNSDFVNSNQAYTYIFWANIVLPVDCRKAKESLSKADSYLNALPPSFQQTITLRSWSIRLSGLLASCQ
jgi:hypothetical protein